MNEQICPIVGQEPWRIKLREYRERTKMSYKQIADKVGASEKTISRIFLGDAKNPGTDLMNRIIHVLGATWGDIFGESGAVIGDQDLVALQAEVDRLTEEIARLTSSLNIANLELAVQKDKVSALEAENKLLHVKLEYEEKLVAVHNFYNKLNSNN